MLRKAHKLVAICLVLAGIMAGLVSFVTAQVPQSQAQMSLSFAPLVRQASPAVANIYVTKIVARRVSPFASDPFFQQFFDFGPAMPRAENSLGSGVVLSADGILVTNTHVVGEAAEIRAVLPGGREFPAEVILSDEQTDLAILRLIGAEDLPYLDLADSDAAEVGDLVLAIGNPFGVGQTVSSGIVSGLARSGGMASAQGYFIQTDAPINPGNSGGALIDMTGRLLGVNTAILTRSGGSNGIGFAIPSNLVAAYVDQAQAGAPRIQRPWAGIAVQAVDTGLAGALDQTLPQGVVIAAQHPQSPFASAGLEVGDVILKVAGKPVNSRSELDFRMMTAMPAGQASVSYARAGAPMEAVIDLAPAPDEPPAEPVRVSGRSPLSGLEVARINPALIDALGLPLDAGGVAILSVDGFAVRLGLRPGDVLTRLNGQRINAPSDVLFVADQRARDWDIELIRDGQRSRLRFRL